MLEPLINHTDNQINDIENQRQDQSSQTASKLAKLDKLLKTRQERKSCWEESENDNRDNHSILSDNLDMPVYPIFNRMALFCIITLSMTYWMSLIGDRELKDKKYNNKYHCSMLHNDNEVRCNQIYNKQSIHTLELYFWVCFLCSIFCRSIAYEVPYLKKYISQLYLNRLIKPILEKTNNAILALSADIPKYNRTSGNQTVLMIKEEAVTLLQELMKYPRVIKVLDHYTESTQKQYLLLFLYFLAKLRTETSPTINKDMLMKLLIWAHQVNKEQFNRLSLKNTLRAAKKVKHNGNLQDDFTHVADFLLGPNNKLEESLLVMMFFQYLNYQYSKNNTPGSYCWDSLPPIKQQLDCLSKTTIVYLEAILRLAPNPLTDYIDFSESHRDFVYEEYKKLRVTLTQYKILLRIKQGPSSDIKKLSASDPWHHILSYLFHRSNFPIKESSTALEISEITPVTLTRSVIA